MANFKEEILEGIPNILPPAKPYDREINHAPRRKDILSKKEKELALKNALRYFPKNLHKELAPEFAKELADYGRIYMYRYRPNYKIYARPIDEYPAKSRKAAAIMAMIQNNLDERVAQHPHELIVYGGNGAIFQNWAQYRLTMQYLATMTDEQTLSMYSGHPLGLFPSHKDPLQEFQHLIASRGIFDQHQTHSACNGELLHSPEPAMELRQGTNGILCFNAEFQHGREGTCGVIDVIKCRKVDVDPVCLSMKPHEHTAAVGTL
mgnify:CR=1 FL=1